VLLDNVGNGWTYNAITWSDVATRDLTATAMMVRNNTVHDGV
jgi:hypothetical protein